MTQFCFSIPFKPHLKAFELAIFSPKKIQEFHEVVDAGLGQLAFYNTNLQSYMEMTDKAADGRKKESHPGVIALEGNPEILGVRYVFF